MKFNHHHDHHHSYHGGNQYLASTGPSTQEGMSLAPLTVYQKRAIGFTIGWIIVILAVVIFANK